MDDYLLFAAGVAMAAIIVFFMREMSPPLPISSRETVMRAGAQRGRFSRSQGEVFTPKVLVIEFDESGPGLQVNGEYHNPFERMRVDLVAAEVTVGGTSMEMVCVEEEDENELSDKYIGDLVSLSSPTWLEEDQAGKFRAPMRDMETEDLVTEILGEMDGLAERMALKMDMDLVEYSLDEASLEKMTSDFLSDSDVRRLMGELEKLFPWRAGHVSITTWFTDPEEGIIDEIPMELQLGINESESLLQNIRAMTANTLLAELGMDLLEYRKIILEE